MNTVGQRIIDAIITGKLCHASCAHDPNHECIVVWSSGAAEQLDALANTETDVLRQERDQLRARVADLERQLAEAGKDKERLDWLEDAYAIQTPKTRTDDVWCVVTERPYYARRLRAAIDTARRPQP